MGFARTLQSLEGEVALPANRQLLPTSAIGSGGIFMSLKPKARGLKKDVSAYTAVSPET